MNAVHDRAGGGGDGEGARHCNDGDKRIVMPMSAEFERVLKQLLLCDVISKCNTLSGTLHIVGSKINT